MILVQQIAMNLTDENQLQHHETNLSDCMVTLKIKLLPSCLGFMLFANGKQDENGNCYQYIRICIGPTTKTYKYVYMLLMIK